MELYKDIEKILFTKEEIAEKVKELGKKISEDYHGKNVLLICTLRGASVFFSDLIREIDADLTIDFIAMSSYGASTKTSGEVKLTKDLATPISRCAHCWTSPRVEEPILRATILGLPFQTYL